jgi:hypothetical protein
MFKKLIEILFGQPKTGARLDERPLEQRKEDIPFKDVVASANPVVWEEKTSYRTLPVMNQNQTNACGAYSLSKHLSSIYLNNSKEYIKFSVHDIYQRRANKPYPGMNLWDMARIAKEGVTLQELTQGLEFKDVDLDSYPIPKYKRDVGNIFSIEGEPIYVTGGDIETLASIIQTTEKSIIGLFFFTSEEWSNYVPVVKDKGLVYNSERALRHYVNLLDYTLYNGQKCLVVEDSSHFGGFNRRLITEDFLKKRNFINMYMMNFKFSKSSKPSYTGTFRSLQKCLQSEGYFPVNVSFVENYGPITRKAVRKFKVDNGLDDNDTLDYQTVALIKRAFP